MPGDIDLWHHGSTMADDELVWNIFGSGSDLKKTRPVPRLPLFRERASKREMG
jgi:hypothetical protein